MNFIFYDLETTGRNSTWDQIIQVAAILVDENFNEIEKNLKKSEINVNSSFTWLTLTKSSFSIIFQLLLNIVLIRANPKVLFYY